MKNMFIAFAMGGMLCSFGVGEPVTWGVDKAHSRVGFSITHNMASDVEGSFKTFDASIVTTRDDFAGAVFEFTADAASISTDNPRRDDDIRSADFLDVGKFPKVIFESRSVSKLNASTYKIGGALTMHGVTRGIVLDAPVRIPPVETGVKDVAGFKVTGIVKRSDFGIGGAYADMLLSDAISLDINGEFKKTLSGNAVLR